MKTWEVLLLLVTWPLAVFPMTSYSALCKTRYQVLGLYISGLCKFCETF